MAAQSPPSSGRVVTVNSSDLAMKIAAVFRCVDILSAGVASLPFECKRYNKAEGILSIIINPNYTIC